jgi:hypothetical protein
MTDEKYSYIQDIKDKKTTARSARNKRTHNGKGGRVKFPSDYMTQKEIKAMSGEVKSYRLNEPMSLSEFRSMPDDIKVSYISLIRQKYNAPDCHICKMMGTNTCTFSQEMNRLGIPSVRHPNERWDKEGFFAWANGVPAQKEEPVEEAQIPEVKPLVDIPIPQQEPVAPMRGTLEFEGTAEDIFSTLNKIVGNGNVRMTISWEAV